MIRRPEISKAKAFNAVSGLLSRKQWRTTFAIYGAVALGMILSSGSSDPDVSPGPTMPADTKFSDILTQDFMARVSMAESGGGRKNINPRNSKVLGPFQIHEQTFLGALHQEGENIGYKHISDHIKKNKSGYYADPGVQGRILKLRMEFDISAAVARVTMDRDLQYVRDKDLLQNLRTPNQLEGAAYAMHHFGRAGGERFLRTLATAPKTPFRDIAQSPDVCVKNPVICYEGNKPRSVGKVFQLLQEKLGWQFAPTIGV